MIPLSPRLRRVFDAVGECRALADIGSDHAKLLIALLQAGKIKKGIAADINIFPLEKSRLNAEKYGAEIDFALSDGFASLEKASYDKAAVCGMGGTTIAAIIAAAGEKARCPLILQPMTAHCELRKFLWDNGFSVTDENFAVEGKRPYVVLNAVYTGKNTEYSYAELYLGKIMPKTSEYAIFCGKIKAQALLRLRGAATSAEKRDINGLIYKLG